MFALAVSRYIFARTRFGLGSELTMKYAFVALAVFATTGYAAKFPSNWSTCKLKDPKHNECMKKAIQGTLEDLVKGMPHLGIKSIDPLRFDHMAVSQGNGPVSLNLTFDDFDLLGIHTGTVDKVQNDEWKRMVVDVSVPTLSAKGKYSIAGKVLVLPISGNGNCEIILENFKANFDVKFKETTKGGKTYYNMDKLDMKIYCDKFIPKFENLFNGNKQLGEQMNVFLNENEKEVFRELEPALSKAIGEGLRQLGNRLFSRIPKNEITPS